MDPKVFFAKTFYTFRYINMYIMMYFGQMNIHVAVQINRCQME